MRGTMQGLKFETRRTGRESYDVMLGFEGRGVKFSWYLPAHLQPITERRVMSVMTLDAALAQLTFAEWCRESNIKPHDPLAFRMYREQRRALAQLQALLGPRYRELARHYADS